MNEIFVRLVPLPPFWHGFVKEDPDGDYNMYIREQDSRETQLDTYAHEMAHIKLGHLQRDRDLDECEAEADAYMKRCQKAGRPSGMIR